MHADYYLSSFTICQYQLQILIDSFSVWVKE